MSLLSSLHCPSPQAWRQAEPPTEPWLCPSLPGHASPQLRLWSALCSQWARGNWQGVEGVSGLGLPLRCSMTLALLHPWASGSSWVRGGDIASGGGDK